MRQHGTVHNKTKPHQEGLGTSETVIPQVPAKVNEGSFFIFIGHDMSN